MEMFLTGRRVAAEEAKQWGMVNVLAAAGEEKKAARELALKVTQMAPIALQMTKKAMRLSWKAELAQALDLLAAFQGITQRTDDHREAVNAFVEKRQPIFKEQ